MITGLRASRAVRMPMAAAQIAEPPAEHVL
jgi:hypothetical protein